MRTANPALNKKTFTNFAYTAETEKMTIQGTVNKTLVMLLLLIVSAGYTWRHFFLRGRGRCRNYGSREYGYPMDDRRGNRGYFRGLYGHLDTGIFQY